MNKVKSSLLFASAFIVTIALPVVAENAQPKSWGNGVWIAPNFGISKSLGEKGGMADDWNLGFLLSSDFLIQNNPYLSLGLHAAFNRWTPNQDFFIKQYEPIQNVNSTGSASIFEAIPFIRFALPLGTKNPSNIFGHIGLGYCHVNYNAKISGTLSWGNISGSEDISTEFFLNENRLGIALGGGLGIGLSDKMQLQIHPLYHLMLFEEEGYEKFQYFTISAGLSFLYTSAKRSAPAIAPTSASPVAPSDTTSMANPSVVPSAPDPTLSSAVTPAAPRQAPPPGGMGITQVNHGGTRSSAQRVEFSICTGYGLPAGQSLIGHKITADTNGVTTAIEQLYGSGGNGLKLLADCTYFLTDNIGVMATTSYSMGEFSAGINDNDGVKNTVKASYIAANLGIKFRVKLGSFVPYSYLAPGIYFPAEKSVLSEPGYPDRTDTYSFAPGFGFSAGIGTVFIVLENVGLRLEITPTYAFANLVKEVQNNPDGSKFTIIYKNNLVEMPSPPDNNTMYLPDQPRRSFSSVAAKAGVVFLF